MSSTTTDEKTERVEREEGDRENWRLGAPVSANINIGRFEFLVFQRRKLSFSLYCIFNRERESWIGKTKKGGNYRFRDNGGREAKKTENRKKKS